MKKIIPVQDEFIKIKHRGKIYTPDYLVNIILNQGNYVPGNINKKHVIDNSCGDGQFIIHVVDRYCKDFLLNSNDKKTLKKELETYIHAIEIDKNELALCTKRCNILAEMYGIHGVNWDFLNEDALKVTEFDNKMDFVVGNPPYVRVHNLLENFNSVKDFSFATKGMTDLFIVFYEIGIKMMNENGKLAYITPSSFFTSVAGQKLRDCLIKMNLLESVCDLKHFQPFNATTYTTIICLNKNKPSCVKYYEFDGEKSVPVFIDTLSAEDFVIKDSFYFSTKSNLKKLKDILTETAKVDISVKNGYATLADKVFINDFSFDSKYIIPVIKASRGKWTKIFYPYDKKANLVPEDCLQKESELFKYLKDNKGALLKRSNERDADKYWYSFGRSQALKDTFKEKIAINTLIKKDSQLKIEKSPAGTGVYSGLYIISDTFDYNTIKEVLADKDLNTFISLLGKYKSGGYYTFSTKDMQIYLNYKLKNKELKNAV